MNLLTSSNVFSRGVCKNLALATLLLTNRLTKITPVTNLNKPLAPKKSNLSKASASKSIAEIRAVGTI
jgi:hypothetical protein